MTTSDDFDTADDRAIARALAQPGTEDDPVDQTTGNEYQDVLAHLPFDEVAPPADLEARMLSAARAARAPTAPALERARSRRTVLRVATVAAALAGAAAVIVLALPDNTADDGVTGQIEATAATSSDVEAALASSGARTVHLGEFATLTLTTAGDGFLYDISIDPDATFAIGLRTDELIDIPIGAIEPDSEVVRFVVDGDLSTVSSAYLTRDGVEVAAGAL